ncbi:oxidoreductase [Pelobium manganitolerans]|uniref:oxidoreductase n=1 Tax=Pelobium manganitolerans TaxID=1842495 RepID=UPI003FA346FD
MQQKVALITGANAGLGFEVSKVLVQNNFRLIMACRNTDKALLAKAQLIKLNPNALIDVFELDLASQQSIRFFAKRILEDFERIDLLINNAGVMMTPYELTEDDFELQLATNFLGHFVLTGSLLKILKGRVICLSSLAHRWSEIRLKDPNFTKGYSRRAAYGQSKLACLMFALELNRRLKASGSDVIALAAHPGISNTNLFKSVPKFLKWLQPFLAQPSEEGAKPILYAALSPKIKGGEYIGPDGFKEWRGKPTKVAYSDFARNKQNARRLWDLAEQLTGFKYDFNNLYE